MGGWRRRRRGERERDRLRGTYLIALYLLLGGIGGLVLAIFHKFETMEKTKRLRECCPLLQRKEAEVRENPVSL